MNISYSSEDLINEVKEDILIFGSAFKVFAVYSWYPDVGEFITDYVHAEKPQIKEVYNEAEYQKLLDDYEKSLKTLEKSKYDEMTLSQLLQKLEAQNKIM